MVPVGGGGEGPLRHVGHVLLDVAGTAAFATHTTGAVVMA